VEEVFRPGFGRVLSIALAAGGVISLASITVNSGLIDAALTVPWLALFGTCVWAIFWRPHVVVSDAGVRLVNVTRTIDVPWPALIELDTRYALTLTTSYGRFAAWAAPAPGAGAALRSSMRSRSRRDPADGDIQTSSMGELAGTASGDAAFVVRRRWEQLRAAGHLDAPRLEFDQAPIRWHWGLAAAVVGLSALSVMTLFLG
jgi:hypothetical protein